MTFLLKIGFLEISFIDVVDVLLVSFLFYQLYKLVKGSVAINIFLGLLLVYLFYLLVEALEMKLLTTILGQFIGIGVLAMVILFQQEIRKFLLVIGRSTAFNNEKLKHIFHKNIQEEHTDTNAVVKAAKELSITKTGALIAFAKEDELESFGESGDLIDAAVSKRLLVTIFNKTSPMHDGGVLLSKDRIRYARSIFPVSENEDLPAEYGLRHRAGIGLSEETDAAVLIVSEESGNLSLAIDGEVFDNLDSATLRLKLNTYLYEDEELDVVGED